ncbi:MAG TPA: DegT/DnrJ/EryC1/StrS aminotransferase family protein [Chitinophagaceae bacterium]|nr:DegT/DnrJ/EryC1/StrS aminotransferase family protein [Chitinophagaceae bacterium]
MQTVNKAFIPLAKPDIREEDIQLVNQVLRTGMLVQGEYVMKLEQSFADYHNVKHAIAVSNGTASLHLALAALGIGQGDEVIVPAFSYVATANVVELVGATCVFVDIDESTFNIDVAAMEQKISVRTKAIIPVHEFGLACDIEKVCEIAARYNLHVIEDAACALGAKQNGKHVGSFGILGSFSLHPRKSITSGEGGMLLTNDDAVAKKLRQLRNHGIEMDCDVMSFVEAGFNYRMTDFQAALAYSQFQRLDDILQFKNELSKEYFSTLDVQKFTLPVVPAGRNHTWQTFHVLLNKRLLQREVIKALKQRGIGTNYGAQCIPSQTYYKKKYNHNPESEFPNAYKAYSTGLAIPIYERLDKEDITFIAQTINQL